VLQAHTAQAEPHRLRPLARAVVDAELSMALDRRLRPDAGVQQPTEPETPSSRDESSNSAEAQDK
jgi:hypothetical protein